MRRLEPRPSLIQVTNQSNTADKSLFEKVEKIAATALVGFGFYFVGFLIWEAYLQKRYGISIGSLAKLEFFSATICWLYFVLVTAIPLGLFFRMKTSECHGVLTPLALCIWIWIYHRLGPQLTGDFHPKLYTYYYPLRVMLALAGTDFLLALGRRIYKRLRLEEPSWLDKCVYFFSGSVYFLSAVILVLALHFFEKHDFWIRTSVPLFILALVLWAVGIEELKEQWKKSGLIQRAVLCLVAFLATAFHIDSFARFQFAEVPRYWGGGKPVPAFLTITKDATNFNGPVGILIRSDKEIFFVKPPGSTNAFQLRSDLIDSISFTDSTNSPVVKSPATTP